MPKAANGFLTTSWRASQPHLTPLRISLESMPFTTDTIAWVDIEGEDVIVKAILDDRFGPARIAAHFGPRFSE